MEDCLLELVEEVKEVYKKEKRNVIKVLKDFKEMMKGGKKMGKVILKNLVKRKPGYLYYVDGKGNVCEAKMHRKGRKPKKKKKKK